MFATEESPELAETRRVLLERAHNRLGAIRPERIVNHVLAVTTDTDLSLRRAALEALIRRYEFAERDELRVAMRPPARAVFGTYRTQGTTGANKARPRPYATQLSSLAPLRLSCSCADFVRSALGLCKHGLVVLSALEKSGRLARATTLPVRPGKPQLTWDPVQPAYGRVDRLMRLRYRHAGRGSAPLGLRDGTPVARLLKSHAQRLAFITNLERRVARGSIDVEPAVLTLLGEERARAERGARTEASVRAAMKSLTSLKRKLYPYQREGVQRFFATGRLLLADDMGLGKTTQAIAACHGLFETGSLQRGLLIVPAALKPQWKREWEATTGAPLTLVEGSPEERARIYRNTGRGFLAMGYEQLLRDFVHVQRFAPELVVLDEAQRIKNWATKSAAYVKTLDPNYRLVLTGTPMENRFAELASIMDFVDDVALEPKWRLTPFHTIDEANAANGIGGVRNLDVLRERLADTMLRRVRKEVLAQLPARTDTRVPVDMTDVQRTEHDELRRPIAELMNKASRRSLRPAEFLRLMQLLTTQRMICNGMAQLHFETEWPRLTGVAPSADVLQSLFAPKLGALRGLVEQVVIGQRRKAVIFSQWRNMLRLSQWAIADMLRAAGLRAVFFTGAESPRARERAIVDLHDDPAAAVMFLSDAGGVGLNLQRAASCCVNLELPWNPAVLEQRIGRIYRLGQTLPIDVFNLVSEEGIEANIARLLSKKSAVFSSLFDGTTDEVLFDGKASFMEGVKRLVDAVPVPELPPAEAEADEALSMAPEPALESAALQASAAVERPSAEQLSIERLPDGGLRISAPPALAAPLADLLEGLVQALRASSAEVAHGSEAPAGSATRRAG
jgi:SNF2-related domain/Helicase conserved C-terminal domain